MNNSITELVLIESRSARNNQISNISHERALDTLNKAKALVMAVWQGTGIATNAQLAEYFEIGIDAVESVLRRNKQEFLSDGVEVLRGKRLKEFLAIGSVSLTEPFLTTVLTIWTPRATLRLGMLLQDSPVAKELRSVILDVVESTNPIAAQQQPLNIYNLGTEILVKLGIVKYQQARPELSDWSEDDLAGLREELNSIHPMLIQMPTDAFANIFGMYAINNSLDAGTNVKIAGWDVILKADFEWYRERAASSICIKAAQQFQIQLDRSQLAAAPTQKQLG